MNILYLKGYKWLLSPKKQVINDFFDYRRFETEDGSKSVR